MRNVILLAAMAILFSCDKEEIADTQLALQTSTEITLNSVPVKFDNGLASIPSWSDAGTIETIFYDKEQSLAARTLLSNVPYFTSAEVAYQSINADDFNEEIEGTPAEKYAYLRQVGSDFYVDPIVEHEMLRYLVNVNRQIIIGDRFCTVDQEKLVSIPISEIDLYGSTPLESPNVEVVRLKKRPADVNPIAKANIGRCRDEYGTRRRVTGEIEITDNIFQIGQRLNVRSKHYRRKSFTGNVWWGERADILAHDGAVAFLNSNIGPGTDILQSRTNEQNFATMILERQTNIELELFFGGFFNFAEDGGATDGKCFCVPGNI